MPMDQNKAAQVVKGFKAAQAPNRLREMWDYMTKPSEEELVAEEEKKKKKRKLQRQAARALEQVDNEDAE